MARVLLSHELVLMYYSLYSVIYSDWLSFLHHVLLSPDPILATTWRFYVALAQAECNEKAWYSIECLHYNPLNIFSIVGHLDFFHFGEKNRSWLKSWPLLLVFSNSFTRPASKGPGIKVLREGHRRPVPFNVMAVLLLRSWWFSSVWEGPCSQVLRHHLRSEMLSDVYAARAFLWHWKMHSAESLLKGVIRWSVGANQSNVLVWTTSGKACIRLFSFKKLLLNPPGHRALSLTMLQCYRALVLHCYQIASWAVDCKLT